MSKVWKWIIGILIVLVIAAVVVGGVVMVRNRSLMARSVRPTTYGNGQTLPNVQGTPNAPGAAPSAPASPNGQNRPMMPYGFNGQNRPMMPYGFNDRHNPMGGWGERGPMMGRGGSSHFGRFMPFGLAFLFLGGLVGLVIPLVILALVAFIFYQLGKRAGLNSAKNQTPAPREPAPVDTQGRGRKVAKS